MSNILKTLAAGSAAAGDYQISRSLRFNSADSAYLSRTPASAGNRKTWTWSGWGKPSNDSGNQVLLSAGVSGAGPIYFFLSSGSLRLRDFGTGSGVNIFITNAVYRDFSAWYHIVLAIDTTDATPANRQKLYVNGVQVTSFSSETNFSLDQVTAINNNVEQLIGKWVDPSVPNLFNGYMADINFIDGDTPSTAVDADGSITGTPGATYLLDFGEFSETTGVWTPKRFSGPWNVGTGVNGFYLPFSDNSDVTATTLGRDFSGNGNNWTPSGSPGLSVTAGAGNDSLVDTPTPYGTDTGAGGEVRGNYATLNALNNTTTLSDGNLQSVSTADDWYPTVATFGMSSGKWYWEIVMTAQTAYIMIGIVPPTFRAAVSTYPGVVTGTGIGYFNDDGDLFTNGNGSRVSYGAGYTVNDVIGVALDMDAGTLTFYKNGVSQGTAATGLTGTYLPAFGNYRVTAVANFGQRPFAYTAPSGFKALVTTNLPEPTVVQGDDYFNTVLWTGTGASLGVTGVGFQPDFVWIKERSGAADHGLYDAVRGVTKQLESNTTDAETTEATGLTAFGSDGFTVGALAQLNTSADTYVAWNWKANGAGVSNTDGTITSTVSANTTAGISIITYAGNGIGGATVGHGLGAVPKMFILKERNGSGAADFWATYHVSLGNTKYLTLNTSNAEATAAYWNNTTPSSSVITLGSNTNINDSGGPIYLIYAFAEVEGFSKFGSYTGNGSTDGPFVYTGFRPAWLLVKRSDGADDWRLFDNRRDGFNALNDPLYPNASYAEGSGFVYVDLVSNGFKCRNNSYMNNSGVPYIYAAFAENPFKNSLAR